MFTTYKSYKVPINLKDGSELWHIVERDPGTPWLLAQTKDAEGLGRTFLLHDPNQLVGLARTKGIGKLIRAYIVLPPSPFAHGRLDFPEDQICRDGA